MQGYVKRVFLREKTELQEALYLGRIRRDQLFRRGEDGNLGAALFLKGWLEREDVTLTGADWQAVEDEIEKYLELSRARQWQVT